MYSKIRRSLLAGVLVAGVVAAFGAAPASAHVTVVSKSPATSAKKTVKTARVTFNQAIRSGTLRVYRISNGVKVSIGSGARNPRNLKQLVCTLKSGKAAARYVARWTVVGPDGHRQSGSWRFRLTN
jgi:methionine-rich copper-binding protein CopC